MNKEFQRVHTACITVVLDQDDRRKFMQLEKCSISMESPSQSELDNQDVFSKSYTTDDALEYSAIMDNSSEPKTSESFSEYMSEETKQSYEHIYTAVSSGQPVRSRIGTKSVADISPSASHTRLTFSDDSNAITVPDQMMSAAKPIVRMTKSNPETEKFESETDILDEFEEQARSYQQHLLLVEKHRLPNPVVPHQSVGLDHLDNLVKLMEQLSVLREENTGLKKRCAYLESAKNLLQLRTQLFEDSDMLSPHSQHNVRFRSDAGISKPLAGEADTGQLTPSRRNSSSLTLKRSFSTGSINLPELQIDKPEPDPRSEGLTPLYKNTKHKKSSKWARVKKVLKGQKSEDFSNVSSQNYLVAPKVNLSESRSMDSGVGSGLEALESSRMSSSIDEQSQYVKTLSEEKKESQDDLSTEIWMGPPGWESSTTDHDDAFITKDSVNTFIAPIHRAHEDDSVNAQYLEIDVEMPRRSSSPSFTSFTQGAVKPSHSEDHASLLSYIHRSSSSKSDGLGEADFGSEKKSKTAWGRVKDIITHKDSTKKRHRKLEKCDSDMADGNPMVTESGNGISPQGSTKRQSSASVTKSVRSKKTDDSQHIPVVVVEPTATTNVNISNLMASISDDFTKKMAEWESKKHKKYIVNQSQPSSLSTDSAEFHETGPPKSPGLIDKTGSEDSRKGSYSSFSRKIQAWERMKSQKLGSPLMERRQRSFRREDQKSKKSKPEREKDRFDRQRERDYLKVEREQQKLDREKLRLNKERLRALEREAKIEKMKERLGASTESEMKNPVLKPLSEYKVTSDFAQKLHEWEVIKGMSKEASTALYLEVQKRSIELAQEMYGDSSFMKHHKSHSHSRAMDDDDVVFTTAIATELGAEDFIEKDNTMLHDVTEHHRAQRTVEAFRESPPLSISEPTSPVKKCFPIGPLSEESSMDDAPGGINVINNNIARMEKANIHLLEQLHEKKDSYLSMQLEVRALSEKLSNMKTYHDSLLAEYKNELGKEGTVGKISPHTALTNKTLIELEGKIQDLQNFGEQMSIKMEGTMMSKFQNIEGEETVGARLVELVGQMKALLVKTPSLDEASTPKLIQEDFKHLYAQAMQLQIQMNNLRLTKLERNKEIVEMRRQLLLQEVTNLFLQVDITRREAELLRYKMSRQKTLKRSNTYSGHGNKKTEGRGLHKGGKPLGTRRYSAGLLPLFESQSYNGDYTAAHSLEYLDGVVKSKPSISLSDPKPPRDSTTSADSAEISSAKSFESEIAGDEAFVNTRSTALMQVKLKRDLALPPSCQLSLDDMLSEQNVAPIKRSSKRLFRAHDPSREIVESPKSAGDRNKNSDATHMPEKADSVKDIYERTDSFDKRRSGKVMFKLGASESIDNTFSESNVELPSASLDSEREVDFSCIARNEDQTRRMEKDLKGYGSLPLFLPRSPITKCRNRRLVNSTANQITDDFLRLKDTPPRSQHFTKHLCKQKRVEEGAGPSEIVPGLDNSTEKVSTGFKPSSPGLNLAHIGYISPVKTLKPAAELIQDSRRYRPHTDSMPRRVNKASETLPIRSSSETGSVSDHVDKENFDEFMHSIPNGFHETNDQRVDRAVETQGDVDISYTAVNLGSKKGSFKKDPKDLPSSSDKSDFTLSKDVTNGAFHDSPKNQSDIVYRLQGVDMEDDPKSTEKIPDLITSSPKVTAKSQKETVATKSPTPYSSHSLFSRRKKVKPAVVTFDEGAFSDSEVKPTKYSKRSGKVKKRRPKSMEIPSDVQPLEAPTSPVLRRGFFQKVGRLRSNSAQAPSLPGAVSTLCEKSMTFDLGVSASVHRQGETSHSSVAMPPSSVATPPSSVATPPSSVATPPSSVATPPSSVATPPSSPRQPRQRSKFLDAALQKSKRLFKVSK